MNFNKFNVKYVHSNVNLKEKVYLLIDRSHLGMPSKTPIINLRSKQDDFYDNITYIKLRRVVRVETYSLST